MSIALARGDQANATDDIDGFPAVQIQNHAWVEEPRWITASAYDLDSEQLVRELAQQLLDMADNMAAMRKAEAR